MSKNFIRIGGAREHNLKNLTLEIPRDKLVVITGLSGSGKSSLAFDTIYAQGRCHSKTHRPIGIRSQTVLLTLQQCGTTRITLQCRGPHLVIRISNQCTQGLGRGIPGDGPENLRQFDPRPGLRVVHELCEFGNKCGLAAFPARVHGRQGQRNLRRAQEARSAAALNQPIFSVGSSY